MEVMVERQKRGGEIGKVWNGKEEGKERVE